MNVNYSKLGFERKQPKSIKTNHTIWRHLLNNIFIDPIWKYEKSLLKCMIMISLRIFENNTDQHKKILPSLIQSSVNFHC